MSSSRKALLGVLGAAILLIVGVFALFNLRSEGPAELELGDRTSTTAPSDDVGDDDEGTAPDPTVTGGPDESGIEGTWQITDDSIAGYRVVEDFAGGISNFEAVGRTSTIEGELTIEANQVTAAAFSVDVASIVSDDSRRDGQFAGRIMNSADFPTADFVLTSPIDLGDDPASGEEITVEATGELTLRGVTNTVTFPITARLVNGEVETLGSIPVVFADYDIANPSFAGITVRDEGLVEFLLGFSK